MSDIRSKQPMDANGHPFNRAQGVPIVADNVILGSATKYVDVLDLSSYGERAFHGIAVYNPDSNVSIYIAMGPDFETDKSITVHPYGFLAFDNQFFGPGVADVTAAEVVTKIRAKISSASGTLSSATITYVANPSNGMTVTINGKVFEFSSDQSVNPGRYKVDIKATDDLTWTEFVAQVNAIEQAVTASVNTGTNVVTITSNYGGTYGDGIVVADGGDSGTPTGATFSGNTTGGSGGVTPVIHVW